MRLSSIFNDSVLALPREDVEEHRLVHRAIGAGDADWYSVYEENGKWWLNAGGARRGPFGTRSEAMTAKKTGDSLSQIARDAIARDARGDKVVLTVIRELQSRGARFHGDVMVYRGGRVMESEMKSAPGSGPMLKTAEEVQRLLLPYARKKASELGVEITNKRIGGDALSQIARDAIVRDTPPSRSSIESELKKVLNQYNRLLMRGDDSSREFKFLENRIAQLRSSLVQHGHDSGDALTDLIERARSGLREQTGD